MNRKNIILKGMLGAMLLMATVGLTGCEEVSSNGTRISTVKFTVDEGKAMTAKAMTDETEKAFSASVEMPTLDSLYWTVKAESEDSMAYGIGTVTGTEPGLPTGLKYSYGDWHFTLTASDSNGKVVYKGETDYRVNSVNMSIPISVSLCEINGGGDLRINFYTNADAGYSKLKLYLNGDLVKTENIIDSDGDGIAHISFDTGVGGALYTVSFELENDLCNIVQSGSCIVKTMGGRKVILNIQELKGIGGFDIDVEDIDIIQ